MTEAELPPGLRPWIGRDLCGAPPWVAFHGGLSEAVAHFNRLEFAPALSAVAALLGPVVKDPHAAFDCATAVSAALGLAAQCGEQLGLPVLTARLRQLGAIFASFDYQMKGEEYIDQSPWPIQWMDSMDGILRSMAMLKHHELQADPRRGLPARAALTAQPRGGGRRHSGGASGDGLRVAIVSVCDYDPGATPLARLSQINKESYARRHGYDAFVYEKAPVFRDPLAPLLTDPPSHRPAAWSKVDALLEGLSAGNHDWVMWMDCDSFFMDPEVRLDDFVGAAEVGQCGAEASKSKAVGNQDLAELRDLVERWSEGPPDVGGGAQLLPWYEDLLDEHLAQSAGRRAAAAQGGCTRRAPPGEPPRNHTLGWDDWLFSEGRPHILASEDGLMLNTGIMLVRASVWSWRFFQHVRWMTFGHSPVTQHPWWEQTAMVYLLQLPFALAHAAEAAGAGAGDVGPTAEHPGHARACFMFAQKHLNGYPPIVASALRTHVAFEAGDFIVSFSGCKVYSSQEVCNQLFLGYFFQVHDLSQLAADPALAPWLL